MTELASREGGKRRPNRAALAIAIGLAALAAVIAWDSSHLGTGGAYARIGPQTIPYAIAACLAGLAIWTAVSAFRDAFPRPDSQEWAPVAWIVGGLLAQLLLIKIAGFSVATALLFAMTARGLGRVSFPLALLAGLFISAVVWFVFSRLLQLTLPAGPPEQWMLQIADAVAASFRAPGNVT